MLMELKGNKLEVIALNGLRVVVDTNCPWYQQLCSKHVRFRRGRYRTIIKRSHTIKCLERLIKGDLSGVYAERILEINYVPLDLPLGDGIVEID